MKNSILVYIVFYLFQIIRKIMKSELRNIENLFEIHNLYFKYKESFRLGFKLADIRKIDLNEILNEPIDYFFDENNKMVCE